VSTNKHNITSVKKKLPSLTKMPGTTVDDIDYSDIEEKYVKPQLYTCEAVLNETRSDIEFNMMKGSTIH
jgi:hypothetical protein